MNVSVASQRRLASRVRTWPLALLLAAGPCVAASPPISTADPQAVTYRASELLHRQVRNVAGEALGEVRDILVDADGRVRFLLLSHPGAAGPGEALTAVPWERFAPAAGSAALVLNLSRDALERAPHFRADARPALGDRHLAAAEGYFGFAALDRDHNGYITPQEASGDRRLSRAFGMADTNRDGRLDQAELSAFEGGGDSGAEAGSDPEPRP